MVEEPAGELAPLLERDRGDREPSVWQLLTRERAPAFRSLARLFENQTCALKKKKSSEKFGLLIGRL